MCARSCYEYTPTCHRKDALLCLKHRVQRSHVVFLCSSDVTAFPACNLTHMQKPHEAEGVVGGASCNSCEMMAPPGHVTRWLCGVRASRRAALNKLD